MRYLATAIAGCCLLAACATLPPISPAPPPGTAEYEADAEQWKSIDGYVEVGQGKRARDQAFVAIRRYCNGEFGVVREKRRTTVTVASFPFPYDLTRIFFRCGVPAPGAERQTAVEPAVR